MFTEDAILIGSNENKNVILLPKVANRHGLIAGATGTGKTITLKAMAESFSDMGVPVFLADMKGDLSGLSKIGQPNEKITQRIEKYDLKSKGFAFKSYPVEFWDLFGEKGIPIRVTVSQMGPTLLSKILNLTEAQEGVLNIVFKVADSESLLLIDIKDLKAMINYVTENKDKYESQFGSISAKSANTIIRSLLSIEEQGGNKFFGEPSLELEDFIQCDDEGKGIINVLDAVKLSLAPDIYSTFLLWMLTQIYETLPEVGDLEKPKFIFFFDEAHLLFDGMSPAFQKKVEQIVRLIRSKGVGLYFISQTPADIPDEILSQLGNKVQHALRAYTPKDQKAVKVAAESFRPNPEFDTKDEISNLGIGEALVSLLDEEGVPGIVEKVEIIPPQSYNGAIDDSYRQELINISINKEKYFVSVDRESAYESLSQKVEESSAIEEEAIPVKEETQVIPPQHETINHQPEPEPEPEEQRGSSILDTIQQTMGGLDIGNTTTNTRRTNSRNSGKSEVDKLVQSATNTIVREATRQITRGLFGQLKFK